MNENEMKRISAEHVLTLVESGMKLGIGTGSTMAFFIEALAARFARERLDLQCTVTSQASEDAMRAASRGAIPLASLDALAPLDLTIDGADEIDDDLNLIKGAGGALLREKIVACASKHFVVIGDARKRVSQLGAFALPVEVDSFAHETTGVAITACLADLGYIAAKVELRHKDNAIYMSDGGHYIYDCALEVIADAPALSRALLDIAGVVEHGLFLDMAERAFIATPAGIEELIRK